jgi:branched-chain amino acid transport system permease protein
VSTGARIGAAGAALRRARLTPTRLGGWAALAVIAVLLLLAPTLGPNVWVSQILTQALWLGIAAASLTFLFRYGGMVSLGQVAIYGIAGFAMANVVHTVNSEGGLNLGWNPWLGVLFGIAVAVIISFAYGAIASRSYGIYFLMTTLALSLLVFYFFGQVTQLSGFGGVRSVSPPGFLGDTLTNGTPLYYVCLGCSVGVYLLLRYVVRTPFGIALQGIRDDPPRMNSLGYNVPLHRTLAFTLGAFVASIAGILSVWFNTQISPGNIGIGQTIAVLIISVIGGLSRLEGAWIGALAYTLIDHYSRQWTPTVGNWLGPGQFDTIIGIIFLLIVLLSPDGLIGIGQRVRRLVGPALGESRRLAPEAAPDEHAAPEEVEVPAAGGHSGSGVQKA